MPREAFDRMVESFGAAPADEGAPAAAPSGDIIVFGASWCGACRQAEAYFRGRGIPFVERDIERDPGAREDMQQRARAAGIRATGIPIIDVRGRVMQGFDQAAIERALRETGGIPGTGAGPGTAPAPAPGISI
jgi:glutaredoxin